MFLIFRKIPNLPEEELPLTQEELHHLRVRRLRPGDLIYLGDSIERRWEGHLGLQGKSIVLVDPSAASIHREPERLLFSAVPQGKRWDWLLQKSVELGVTHIQPVEFQRSERYRDSIERDSRILLEAAIQSRRYFLPEIHSIKKIKELPDQPLWQTAQQCYLLQGGSEQSLLQKVNEWSFTSVAAGSSLAAIVGPEGGFEEDEIHHLIDHGAVPVSVGDPILRVETAAIAALSVFLFFPGRVVA